MWSNKGKKKFQTRSANIKSYLGGGRFEGLKDHAEADDSNHSDNDNNSQLGQETSCSTPVQQHVLVEIPEELDISENPGRLTKTKHRPPEVRRDNGNRDDSAAVAEIGNNLDDLDNYMMSVFYNMNDDNGSVYTKGTSDTQSYSCSNSSCSTVSTRRRHRGAAKNRSRDGRLTNDDLIEKTSGSWLESMKRSSMNIFVDGEEGWTPKLGWRMTDKKKEWDSKPADAHWEKQDPMFDNIHKERLEI